jgi:predicted nucleic-acid-binding Zn-ribbon protein
MKKIVHLLVFKIGFDVIASLEVEEQTIFDMENFKCIMASQYNVSPDEIEVSHTKKEKKEPLSADMFIAVTGKLCFHNDFWNVETIEGFSIVDWVDLNTEEGFNTMTDYMLLKKGDELVKFN